MIVSKKFTFDAAHRLYKYSGKCQNIHGHLYVMEVFVEGELQSLSGVGDSNPYNGFVIDFSVLKKIVNTVLVNELDHALILCLDDPLIEVLREETKLFLMELAPTAENMCELFYMLLKQAGLKGLKKVVVWETPTSKAIYEPR